MGNIRRRSSRRGRFHLPGELKQWPPTPILQTLQEPRRAGRGDVGAPGFRKQRAGLSAPRLLWRR